ncbi:MAG: hypothetical protein WD534_15870 [Phycisphaeraceae bacterium]
MNGVLPPFSLPSNVLYFHDWRYVNHGYLQWAGPEGEPMITMPAAESLPPLHARSDSVPRGIRLETMPGDVDPEPVIRASDINEMLFFGGSVIHDQGLYRLFYESSRPGTRDPGHDKVLRYAESDDGLHWRFPELGVVEFEGRRDHNVVFTPQGTGYHGPGTFLDTHGPSEERYKTIWLGYLTAEQLEQYRQRWPDDVDPLACAHRAPEKRDDVAGLGICGAVSPDGLTWRQLEEPLIVQHSDTINVGAFDPLLGKYVLYPRTWYYGRRSIGRAVSDDFRHFTGLQQVIWPGPGEPATDTWYTPGYTTMPDAPDHRLMFATRWSQVDDTFSPTLHTSPDGLLWQRVPGEPMVPFGPTGSWYAAGGAVTTLVELPGDRVGSLMQGWHVPHKHPRPLPGFGQAGWVSWPRGRLTALRADADATFSLYPLRFRGRKLVLNFRTKASGWIRVGVLGTDWYRKIEDCEWIVGDELDHVVTWGGESDLRHTDGESLQFTFELRNADLFSVRFE